jgi:hypothetical protein
MDGDEIVELTCKFCGGRLLPDEQKRPARGVPFRFFRCETCDMPNVMPDPAEKKRR